MFKTKNERKANFLANRTEAGGAALKTDSVIAMRSPVRSPEFLRPWYPTAGNT